jgi:hypothetical protein
MNKEKTVRGAILCLLLTLSASGLNAATPKPVELKDPNGQTVTFYMHEGTRYRLLEPAQLAHSGKGVRVCVLDKLVAVTEQSIRLNDRAFDKIPFVPDAGVKLTSNPGANLWVGGTIAVDGEKTIFRIGAVEEMPSDLELFALRKEALEKREDAAAEDWFRLAWWLDKGKSLSAGLSDKEFNAYNKNISESYDKAMDLEKKDLASTEIKAIAARLRRYRIFVESFGGTVPEGQAAWHLEKCRKFIHSQAKVENAVKGENPRLSEAQKKIFVAAAHLLDGRMEMQYRKNRQEAVRLYRAGAKFSAADPELGKELRDMGYVFIADQWVTPAEAKAIKRELEEKANAEAARKAREQLKQEREESRKRLRAGEDMNRIRTVVDPLLSNPNAANLSELAGMIGSMQEDVARYALWQATGLPPKCDPAEVFAAGLGSKNNNVRADAISLFALRGTEGVLPLIQHSGKEADAGLRKLLVGELRAIPGHGGIDALVQLANAGGVRPDIMKMAADALAEETGENFGPDGFRWKSWWQNNREKFERKAVKQ